jgi:hypothetical protein
MDYGMNWITFYNVHMWQARELLSLFYDLNVTHD